MEALVCVNVYVHEAPIKETYKSKLNREDT